MCPSGRVCMAWQSLEAVLWVQQCWGWVETRQTAVRDCAVQDCVPAAVCAWHHAAAVTAAVHGLCAAAAAAAGGAAGTDAAAGAGADAVGTLAAQLGCLVVTADELGPKKSSTF